MACEIDVRRLVDFCNLGKAATASPRSVLHFGPRLRLKPSCFSHPAFLSSSVGSKQAHIGLISSESHWGPYPKDTGP